MVVTEFGIVIVVKSEQPSNAPEEIVFTEFEMVTFVRPEQLLKA
jgi:hypothetical protein